MAQNYYGQRNRDNYKSQHIKSNSSVAHAPYNFVPLNNSVIRADPILLQDRYHSGRFSGYIDYELDTLTPIYIRGGLSEDDIRNKTEAKDKSDFFSPGGQVRIPGSSLRGMIRSLVEIVSWSKFEFFENKNLYYRGFADRSNLSGEYKTKMNPTSVKTGKSYYNMYAGYLRKEGFQYFIYPAIEGQFEQIPKLKAMQFVKDIGKIYSEFKYYKLNDEKHIIVSGQMPGKKKDWLIYRKDTIKENRIEILEDDIWNYINDENRNKNVPVLTKLCEKEDVPCFYVQWNDAQGNPRVSFGHTGLFRIAYNKSIKEHVPLIHDSDILDYSNAIFGTQTKGKESYLFSWEDIPGKDDERLREILIKINEKLDRNAKIEKVDDGKTIRILDGKNSYIFKLNQEESMVRLDFNDDPVTEFVVKKENDKKNVCMDSFAGRVFFEDAKLIDSKKKTILDEAIPKTLLGPKPTSFQLYLEQDTTDIKKLKHYNNPETHIRGNKFYWHKSGMNWKKEDQDIFKEKIETKIEPVEPNTLFKSRIRYENLTANELGALLFALKLPEGCAHKIGMGKPIGLGSVKIIPTLFTIDRIKRYLTLLDNSGWVLAENKIKDEEIKKFITDFEKHILEKMDSKDRGDATSLWDTHRLKQLRILLDVQKGKNLEDSGKIEYMDLKDFRYRNVLPVPKKV